MAGGYRPTPHRPSSRFDREVVGGKQSDNERLRDYAGSQYTATGQRKRRWWQGGAASHTTRRVRASPGRTARRHQNLAGEPVGRGSRRTELHRAINAAVDEARDKGDDRERVERILDEHHGWELEHDAKTLEREARTAVYEGTTVRHAVGLNQRLRQ